VDDWIGHLMIQN